MCNLNLQETEDAIMRFNQNPINLATDYLTRPQFEQPIAAERIPAMVVVIDGLWGTQLFRDRGVREKIALNLKNNWQGICETMKSLSENDLRETPQKVYEAAKNVFPFILGQGQEHKQHYSFTTKFFHWCTRNHFPIVDSRTRKSINRVQRDQGLIRGLVLTPQEMDRLSYIEEYERWVYFYSDLLNSLSNDHCNRILYADRESQQNTNSALAIENTVLRVLDKKFYQDGGN
jgi:hypothetical protein